MGWGFRKAINFGPFRVNFSKAGVGYSIGARRFRIGCDSRGRRYRAVSIPGTGIYRRDYQPNVPTTALPRAPSTSPAAGQASNRTVWPLCAAGAVVLYTLLRFVFAII